MTLLLIEYRPTNQCFSYVGMALADRERFRALEWLYLPKQAVLAPPENEKYVSDFR